MAQESLNRSSHAYDKHLLSRIGKPSSPPRDSRSESSQLGAAPRKLSLRTTYNSGTTTSTQPSSADVHMSGTESSSTWGGAPLSSLVSPVSRHDWRDYHAAYRSPSVESVSRPRIRGSDSSRNVRGEHQSWTSISSNGPEDPVAVRSSNYTRGEDTSSLTDDLDFTQAEASELRRLNLGDSEYNHLAQQTLIMKRRAPSPASDDGQVRLASPDLYSLRRGFS